MNKNKWKVWTKIVNRGETMPPHLTFFIVNMETKQIHSSYWTLEWTNHMLNQLHAEELAKASGE